MLYHSTRSELNPIDSAQAVLEGLAPDGGLYMPTELPAFDWKKCLEGSSMDMATMILSALLPGLLSGFGFTAVCTAGARIVSSLCNFFMNHKLVFQSRVAVPKAMARYYALAIPQLLAQLLLTHGVYTLFGIGDHQTFLRGLLYGVVMCLLFVASFLIQQRWVFAAKQSQTKNEV